jgi:serine dehydrogenase proteinase
VPTRDERVELIRALETARGGNKVISYLTSTRPNLESQMAMDAIPIIYEHLSRIETAKEETTIDLFLHSNGGDGTVPWRLVTLIREYCSCFNVLVPHNAFSAATLTALGADKVVMHPMGMLGPTDPTATHPFNPPDPNNPGQVLGISVEDVSSYIDLVKEDVGIQHEDELVQAFNLLGRKVHPLALGNVKRATSQSRMMGEKLLSQRPGEEFGAHELAEIIQKLTSQLYFHGHPINRTEARDDVRLSFVVDATDEEAEAMWALYSAYREDMLMGQPFDVLHELASRNELPDPPALTNPQGVPPAITTVELGEYRLAFVESIGRTDISSVDLRVTAQTDVLGKVQTSMLSTRGGWQAEQEAAAVEEG